MFLTSSRQIVRGRVLTMVAVVAAMTLGASACSSPAPAAPPSEGGELRPVVVGANPIVDLAPIWVGKDAGIFEKHGIDLTIETGGGGAALLPSIISGQFQFAFANPTTLMVAVENGLEVEVVANLASSTGEIGADGSALLVPESSTVQTAADLEGKRVAVNTFNSIGTTAIRESVRKSGGDPDEVEFVEIGFGDMMATLAAGDVDAAWEVEPFISASLADGFRAIAWPYVDVAPNLPIALAFTSAELVSSDPELVADFVAALEESIDLTNSDFELFVETIPTYTALDAEKARNLILPRWSIDIDRAAVEKIAAIAYADGTLKKEPDLAVLLP